MAESKRERALAELEQLYASLPAIECKGRCHDACTVIDASELERERIQARGVELPPGMSHTRHLKLIDQGKAPRCPALGPLNTCTVYDVRPMICRAFGMTLDPRTGRGLMCEHGCIPDGTISPQDLSRALIQIEELSRWATGVDRAARWIK